MIPILPRPAYKHRDDMNRYLTVEFVMRVNLAISLVSGDAKHQALLVLALALRIRALLCFRDKWDGRTRVCMVQRVVEGGKDVLYGNTMTTYSWCIPLSFGKLLKPIS